MYTFKEHKHLLNYREDFVKTFKMYLVMYVKLLTASKIFNNLHRVEVCLEDTSIIPDLLDHDNRLGAYYSKMWLSGYETCQQLVCYQNWDVSNVVHCGYCFSKESVESWEYFIKIQCYLPDYWTNTRLVCAHWMHFLSWIKYDNMNLNF